MENIILSPEAPSEGKEKKIVERSAAYPGITLEKSISFIEGVYKNFPGSQTISRADISAVLKTSVVNREIGASVQYGLLDKSGEGYKISDLYKTIHNHLTEKEKRKCLLIAFGSPKLYVDLIEKHDGHVIPNELRTHLIRFHKIVDKASDLAAENFIENAKYVGAVNDSNILNYKKALSEVDNGYTDFTEIIPEGKNNSQQPSTIIQIDNNGQQNSTMPPLAALPEIPNNENIKIPLTEKKVAYLSYPPNIKIKDIEILRKQLDLLELLAE